MRNKNNIEKRSGPGRPLCKIDWKKVDFFFYKLDVVVLMLQRS